jgi:type II secretory pathway pseudopilin PulG
VRVSRFLRDERGMTLMEVLSAATVGLIVLAGVLGLLESSVRLNTGVAAKTDAMQRGRLAMDKVTQQLRSQVCLDLDHPAILAGGTADSVTFYADFSTSDGTKPPERRTLAFSPTTGEITAKIVRTTKLNPVPNDYLGTPSAADLVYENATRSKTTAGVDIPFLRYYAYQTVGDPPHPEPTLELVPPLDDAEAARVARIEVAFTARPTGAKTNKDAVNMTDQIAVRHADPNLSVPDPACV